MIAYHCDRCLRRIGLEAPTLHPASTPTFTDLEREGVKLVIPRIIDGGVAFDDLYLCRLCIEALAAWRVVTPEKH